LGALGWAGSPPPCDPISSPGGRFFPSPITLVSRSGSLGHRKFYAFFPWRHEFLRTPPVVSKTFSGGRRFPRFLFPTPCSIFSHPRFRLLPKGRLVRNLKPVQVISFLARSPGFVFSKVCSSSLVIPRHLPWAGRLGAWRRPIRVLRPSALGVRPRVNFKSPGPALFWTAVTYSMIFEGARSMFTDSWNSRQGLAQGVQRVPQRPPFPHNLYLRMVLSGCLRDLILTRFGEPKLARLLAGSVFSGFLVKNPHDPRHG